VPALIVHLRELFDREITEALCLVKQIEQGPALETPIQIEVSGDDLETKTAQVAAALRMPVLTRFTTTPASSRVSTSSARSP
jgi:hypothetical protein